MNSSTFKRIVVVTVLLALGTSGILCQTSTSQIDIPALIKDCIANGQKYDTAVVDAYTYTKKTTARHGISDTVQVVDVYPKHGRVSEKKVSTNGSEISKRADEREQQRVAAELEKDANQRLAKGDDSA